MNGIQEVMGSNPTISIRVRGIQRKTSACRGFFRFVRPFDLHQCFSDLEFERSEVL